MYPRSSILVCHVSRGERATVSSPPANRSVRQFRDCCLPCLNEKLGAKFCAIPARRHPNRNILNANGISRSPLTDRAAGVLSQPHLLDGVKSEGSGAGSAAARQLAHRHVVKLMRRVSLGFSVKRRATAPEEDGARVCRTRDRTERHAVG